MPKTDDAIDQARQLLTALDQQLTAARRAQTEDARERVAALAFGLTALLDELAVVLPDNDQEVDHLREAVARSPLMEIFEEYSAGRDRRLVVARVGTRWCVLQGFTKAPADMYRPLDVFYDRHEDARAEAIKKHNEAAGRSHWTLRPVEA